MCKSVNHVPLVAVSKELGVLDVPRRRWWSDCESQVPEHQETGREKFLNPMSEARRIQARHRVTDCMSQVSRHREIGRIR